MDWSKRLITTQKNYRYCKKIPSENKTPDTTGLLLLTKINFDRRMNEATEYLASKSQVNPALDVADKNREQMACILIQSKGLWYKTISSVFGKYFKRLYSQLIVMKKNQKNNSNKKTELMGYVHDFSVPYQAIDISDIVNIHVYLIKNTILHKCLDPLSYFLLFYYWFC